MTITGDAACAEAPGGVVAAPALAALARAQTIDTPAVRPMRCWDLVMLPSAVVVGALHRNQEHSTEPTGKIQDSTDKRIWSQNGNETGALTRKRLPRGTVRPGRGVNSRWDACSWEDGREPSGYPTSGRDVPGGQPEDMTASGVRGRAAR